MAGVTRFRPILLTSATTFIGLAPLIATSNWATSFVIPMAISLAFGVMFATVITLFLVPALYTILEDFGDTGRDRSMAIQAPRDRRASLDGHRQARRTLIAECLIGNRERGRSGPASRSHARVLSHSRAEL